MRGSLFPNPCSLCYLSVSASTPGSFLPSKNSSEAPPPVEMWVIWSATPAWLTLETGSDLNSVLLIRQRLHAGQFLAFQKLQRSPAAGGDVGDLVGYAGLVDRRDRVAAADDGDGRAVGRDGMGDGVGAHGKAGKLEDAGRAVPDDGACGRNYFFNGRDGLGTDVQPLPVSREVN